jgi:hypothetical protein
MAATRLHFTASVEEQRRALAGPWLREQAGVAWKNPKPTVVLTPSRAESFYLRSCLVEEGVPFLGLRFWTPSDARKFLLAELLPEVGAATQAELRLVARTCAEKLACDSARDNATLASVIREPGAFLRAYDLLLGAGWDPAKEGAVYGRELAREMQRVLEKSKIATQAGLHRELWRKVSSKKETLIANLLVVGFNATHWPLWDLLKAAVFSAEEATVVLSEPRYFAEDIDQLWYSSWEEVTGTEAVSPSDAADSILSDEPHTPFADLVASYEKGDSGAHRADPSLADLVFLVTPDLASQTRSVVLLALDYLRRDSCTRLGIVFPEANALALGVAEELRRLGIPLDDGTGSLLPGLFEQCCWQSWIALQEEPGVQRFIAWLRACEAQGVSSGRDQLLTARDVAKNLDGALGESLVDDLNFLALHLEENSKGNQAGAVADFLRHRIVLPEEATFSEYLTMTREALNLPGWENHLTRLRIDPPAWLQKSKDRLSRRTFLEWLKESTDSQTRTRGTNGNHFYGKVHLLIYAQMTGQTWTHLILTGMNEGVWPRVFEAGAFGSRHELMALNQQARELNRLGTSEGGQGMGQKTVSTDRGHCLLPLERQDLALRDLCAALESTSTGACLTAMTTEGGRSLLPSDFFNHAYQAKMGRVLNEETFRSLATATGKWCKRHAPAEENKSGDTSEIAATRIAYAARRDATRPFGPYEFAYAQPPGEPIQLSCKQWDDAWNHPSAVWLEKIVGASPWPEGALSWPRAVGTWTHRWLAVALRECRERKSVKDFLPLLLDAADRDAREMRDRARAAGVELYPWWEQVWGRAKTQSLQLGESLAPLLPDHLFLSELTLPRNLLVALPGSAQADFQLKGRIDFLRIEEGEADLDPQHLDFTDCNCWVIDFKTGAAKALTPKNILKGTGLQALLYALAVRALGSGLTSMSLLASESEAKAQVELNAGLDPILAALEKLHRDGVFGMRPDAGSDYGYAPSYPIATQFIPVDILEAKWELTHGASGEGDA